MPTPTPMPAHLNPLAMQDVYGLLAPLLKQAAASAQRPSLAHAWLVYCLLRDSVPAELRRIAALSAEQAQAEAHAA